ncbi:hypothetical protein ZMTM_12100 [Methyloradius palustris]|uniref:Uncharacterized protein n=2 Tax=Methyloradius palustris TaxID=2778876 RepID=A0A8D5G875_9PROT|nr:hypothetical protein ZMTM_12100 [Methyloradius palustris]
METKFMNFKQFFYKYLGEDDLRNQSQSSDKYHSLKSGQTLKMSVLLGVGFYFLIYFILGKNNIYIIQLKNDFRSSLLWVIPQMIFFSCALLIILIGVFFGSKDGEGKYIYEKKYIWIPVVLKVTTVMVMATLGFLVALLFFR